MDYEILLPSAGWKLPLDFADKKSKNANSETASDKNSPIKDAIDKDEESRNVNHGKGAVEKCLHGTTQGKSILHIL